MIGLVPGDPLLSIWFRRHLLFLSGIDESGGDASIDIRKGDEMAQFRIVARIRERPLFGTRRILWILRADQSPEIDPEDLLNRNGRTSTTVVLEGPEKILSAWSRKIPVFHLAAPSKPSDRELWLNYLAKKHGLSLQKGAMSPLLTTFEGSLGPVDRLFREISQETGSTGERPITEAALEKMGITSHYKTVFELIRGLESGDKKFFREWERFLENGQSPFGLLTLLHRQWKLYRIAKSSLSGPGATPGKAESAVSAIGGVPPFIAGSIVRFSRNLSKESIRKGMDALWEADILLKSGLPASLVMDRLATTLFALSFPKGKGEEAGRSGKRISGPA